MNPRTRPRRRVHAATRHTTSWDDAFDLIAERFPAVTAEYGKQAAALYLGNPNAHSVAGALYV
ncbi:hypothetical protein, partial [Nocardia cyriacigeorgica]|uniref:hypothetical protein n=1 Tax=Nocardia cyriacigeorgica TaxID=135487 RepID=UPI002456A4B7